jgi:hypothetical protein
MLVACRYGPSPEARARPPRGPQSLGIELFKPIRSDVRDRATRSKKEFAAATPASILVPPG